DDNSMVTVRPLAAYSLRLPYTALILALPGPGMDCSTCRCARSESAESSRLHSAHRGSNWARISAAHFAEARPRPVNRTPSGEGGRGKLRSGKILILSSPSVPAGRGEFHSAAALL